LLWRQNSNDTIRLASEELEKIHFCKKADILEAFVVKMPQAYPGYMEDYRYFPQIRTYLDQIENLFLIGRNGTHRYNNQDHSMLTAMKAVENIVNNRKDKSNIWDVNTDLDYHEKNISN
jgi:protoporphyrinogen oxidase